MRAVLSYSLAVLCLLQCCAAVSLQEFIGYPFYDGTHQVADLSIPRPELLIKTTAPFLLDGHPLSEFVIDEGFLTSRARYISVYPYTPFRGICYNLVNSVFYKAFAEGEQGSNTTLQEVSQIVSSSSEFKQLFVCPAQFKPVWAMVVTWLEVPVLTGDEDDSGSAMFSGSGVDSCLTSNTFQVVLTTDGTLSFVVMNYAEINQRALLDVGIRATRTLARLHPNSGTPDIVNIDTDTGNTGEFGQWVFRTDIVAMDITPREKPAEGRLLLTPGSGTTLGGTPVRILGPCVQDPKNILCIFDNEGVNGEYISDKEEFVCITPMFQKTGSVPFTIKFTSGNGEEESYSTIFSVVVLYPVPVLNDEQRRVGFQTDKFPLTTDSKVRLTWNSEILPFQPPQSYKVDIILYTLDLKDGGDLKAEKTAAAGITNSGTATISIPPILFPKGTVAMPVYCKVAVAEKSLQTTKYMGAGYWTDMGFLTSTSNLKYSCERWYRSQPDGKELIEQVEPCPRTTRQARLPNSNFVQEGFDVYSSHIMTSKVFQPNADTCYRQRLPKSGTSAGNQCCYRRGNLCTEPECGGTTDAVSPRDWFSLLEHVQEDVLPAIYCCTNVFSDCDLYYEKRPIDDGTRSPPPPPPPACVYGDPHIVTLDAHKYTFNGKGEFTLIETQDDSFSLQGRMIEAETSDGEASTATVFSALVGKEEYSDTVQIELTSTGLGVLVNGEKITFGGDQGVLEFQNVSVRRHSMATMSASFANGVYIEVTEENEIISVVLVSLPVVFRGMTSGLMGNFNGDVEDDLIPKGEEEPIPLDSSLQVIHEQFGITWIIDDPSNSLFSYTNKSWADYFCLDFAPVFEPTFTDPDEQMQAMDICADDTFCLFDIAATKREEVGMTTKQGNQDLEIITMLSQPVVCDPECANGTGVCVANDTCSCAPGYLGDTCAEQDIKPCEVNSCQNGGTCTQSVGLVMCDCPDGFAGKQCQIAFTSLTVEVVGKVRFGYVIKWEVHPEAASTIQLFKVTSFQLGDDVGDGDRVTLDVELDSKTRLLYVPGLTKGRTYHIEVAAMVANEYGPPDGTEVIF